MPFPPIAQTGGWMDVDFITPRHHIFTTFSFTSNPSLAMMNQHTRRALLFSSMLPFALSANWEKIEDFEGDPSNPDYTYVVALGERDSPSFNFLPDPSGADNTALWLDPETYGTAWTVVYVNWVLPSVLPEGSKGTFCLRIYSEADSEEKAVALVEAASAKAESF